MITNNISSDKNKKACRVLSEGFDDEMSPQLSFQSLVEVVKDMMNSISKQLNDTHLLTRELAFASPWVALFICVHLVLEYLCNKDQINNK